MRRAATLRREWEVARGIGATRPYASAHGERGAAAEGTLALCDLSQLDDRKLLGAGMDADVQRDLHAALSFHAGLRLGAGRAARQFRAWLQPRPGPGQSRAGLPPVRTWSSHAARKAWTCSSGMSHHGDGVWVGSLGSSPASHRRRNSWMPGIASGSISRRRSRQRRLTPTILR